MKNTAIWLILPKFNAQRHTQPRCKICSWFL